MPNVLASVDTWWVNAALQRIGTSSGVLPFSTEDTSGYCIDFLVMKKVEESKALKFAIHFLLSEVHGAARRCRVGFRVHAYDACRRLTDVERELVFR